MTVIYALFLCVTINGQSNCYNAMPDVQFATLAECLSMKNRVPPPGPNGKLVCMKFEAPSWQPAQ